MKKQKPTYPLAAPSEAFLKLRRRRKAKAAQLTDLAKRDADERALAEDLSAYMAGLADRIALAAADRDKPQ